jgi:putative ATP-dependent endonuclease of the OLD family
MYLAKLSISNFRGVSKAEIKLSQHFILLGNNNSGKSTIIDAIGLVLGKESLVRNIGDWDFFGGNPQPQDRIIINGLLTGFTVDDEARNKEWFNNINGGIPKWYNEETGEILNAQDGQQSLKLAVEIGFAARFNKDDLEFETIRYFSAGITDPFEEEGLKNVSRELNRQIGFFLIPSKRNWEKIISFSSEIFRKVVDFQEAIPADSIFQIRNDLRNNPHGIEKETPFKEIVDRINLEIKGFAGKEMNLNFLPTNADIESAKNSITPFLLGRGNTNIPLGSHGSGLISLQTLLLLLEFGRFRQANQQNFILAAEEPELHMHPGMHRRLIGRIRGLSTQTIISTHSPEIAAYYKPNEINIVETQEDGNTRVSPLVEKNTPPQNALMRLFTIYRKETSEALMHSKIIIPEGISEFYWLNKLVSAFITTEGWDVTDTITSFGIIPTQDSNVVQSYTALSRIGTFLIPFVDGDAAGKGYVKNLKNEAQKPSFILQLKDTHFLEHLIAWIILPNNQQEEDKLKAILDQKQINYYDINALGALLASDYKSFWKVHDELIEIMVETPAYSQKVRNLIKALDKIVIGCDPATLNPEWMINANVSTADTIVLTLNIY